MDTKAVVENIDTVASMNETKLIETLEGEGITLSDIKRLIAAGYSTVESVDRTPKKILQDIKGIDEFKANKLKEAAKKLVFVGFRTASEVYRTCVWPNIYITTGSAKLDRLLGGGIQTGSITEIFGEFGTGRTQLCHTLAATCQLPVDRGGANGKCLYIDTEGAFRLDRIIPTAARFEIPTDAILDNVHSALASNTDDQTELLMQAMDHMHKSRYALLIVDSATSLYRLDHVGDHGELAARQIHLIAFLRLLMRARDDFNVAVVITNQVVAQVDGVASTFSGDKKPVGGHALGNFSTKRLYFKKGRGNTLIGRVYASRCLPKVEATFAITPEGINDVE